MKVLHLIRSSDDALACGIIDEIPDNVDLEQTVLLIHDGVYLNPKDVRTFACADDVRARGIETKAPLVGYDEIVDMIIEHDRVITW